MTESLTKLIVNCETNNAEVLPLTVAEIAEIKKTAAASKIRLENEAKEAEAKAIAKAALLDRMGLTAEEAALLLG